MVKETTAKRARACRGGWWALVLCGLSMATPAAEPARRALIVGVSDYAGLPPRSAGGAGPFDLDGPKADVPRMVRLARELGVPDDQLRVLANGVTGANVPMQAPTRAAILQGLADLAADSHAGDQVLVYFSGHGSQAPDLEGDEADGLDELMLPSDIGTWQDEADMIENAITDDEFGAAIAAIRARGAYVWVIVDSCHSGTALRGGPVLLPAGMESKGVAPGSFGVPAARLQQARSAAATRALPGKFEPGALDAGDGGGVVAFYAATAEEAAIGGPMRLADGSTTPTTSLLTFALTEAMASGQIATYRDLVLRVRGAYDAMGKLAPQPAFEGDFDRAAFGHARVPPRQWGVRRQGSRYLADGGMLDGLQPGAILAVRDTRDDRTAPIAYLAVTQAGATQSELQPTAHAGLAADAAVRLVEGMTFAGSTVSAGLPMGVRVARPDSATNPNLAAAIARLEQTPALLGATPVSFVAAEAPADLYLRAGADRVWFADRSRGFDTSGRGQPPSLPLAGDADALAQALAHRLAAFARQQRLLAVMRALETSAPADLAVTVAIDSSGRRAETQPCAAPTRQPPANAKLLATVAADNGGVPTLRHCDVVYVTVENRGRQSVDMTPLYFDRDFGISYLESGELEGIRLPPGASHTYLAPISTFDAGAGRPLPLGLEELVLIAVPRATGQEAPAVYAYLAQPGAPRPVRAAGQASAIDALIDDAGFGGTRGAASVGREAAGTLRFSWTVAP